MSAVTEMKPGDAKSSAQGVNRRAGLDSKPGLIPFLGGSLPGVTGSLVGLTSH